MLQYRKEAILNGDLHSDILSHYINDIEIMTL